MKRLSTYIFLGFILSMLLVASGLAAASYPAAEEDFAQIGNGQVGNTTALLVESSGDPSGNCITRGVTYLKFDLSSLIGPSTNVTSATLDIDAQSIFGSTTLTMELWGLNGDDSVWSEGTTGIIWETRPVENVDLNSTQPAAATGTLAFPSTAEFVAYINNEIETDADGEVTIVIKPLEGVPGACTTTGNTFQIFNPGSASLTLEGTGPTAVEFSSASASESGGVNLALILGVIGLLSLSGLAIGRKFFTS